MKETILGFLKEHNTMSLATTKDNFPFAASLFYANYEFTIYFLSSPASQHALNISRNPNVAVTINKDYSEWRMIKGLQIKGKAYEVPRGELEIAERTYAQKYPFLKETLGNKKLFRRAADIKFFKVIPERIRLIDNQIGFGYKVEVRI
ncbi:MAG: pyridoxamine 5'-phosphate oxidase family protein [Deltaproteobacteria bacterium]|nr:pyridoxamine 5'-phosphate oxidase family protein [Deltaproteobacteria bacterium]